MTRSHCSELTRFNCRQTGSLRAFATATGGGGPGGKDDASAAQQDGGESTPQPQGWISRILTGPQANPSGQQSQSHSSMLSASDCIYELQSKPPTDMFLSLYGMRSTNLQLLICISAHDAAAGKREEYLQTFGKFVGEAKNATPGLELVGSWTVVYGNQDQLIHLWRYNNGWADVDKLVGTMNEPTSCENLVSSEHGLITRHFASPRTKCRARAVVDGRYL